jgi:hypothetical protein
MESGAMLKVKVELAQPLVTPTQLAQNIPVPSTPSVRPLSKAYSDVQFSKFNCSIPVLRYVI